MRADETGCDQFFQRGSGQVGRKHVEVVQRQISDPLHIRESLHDRVQGVQQQPGSRGRGVHACGPRVDHQHQTVLHQGSSCPAEKTQVGQNHLRH